MHRLLARTLLLACATLLVACPADDGGTTVEMTDERAFEPKELTVKAGDTVLFRSVSEEAHTVTAYEEDLPDGADYFSSGGADSEEEARDEIGDELIPPDDAFEWTFEEPGTYRYFCIPHEDVGMTGTIVVEE